MFEKQRRVEQRKETLDHVFEKNRFLLKFNDYLVRHSTELSRKASDAKLREARQSVNQAIVDKLDKMMKSPPKQKPNKSGAATTPQRVSIKHS